MDPILEEYLRKIDAQKAQSQGITDKISQVATDRPTDYSPYAALAQATAQLGTIGGRAADTSVVSKSADALNNQAMQDKKQNLMALNDQQGNIDKQTGLNLKTLEYLQGRKDKSQDRNDMMGFRRDQLAQQNQLRKDQLASQTSFKANQMQDRQAAVSDKTNDHLINQLKEDLDPNKGKAGNLGFNQKKVDQAERLEGLIHDSQGQVSNLDSRQIEELAIGLNSMLSNSSSSAVSQVKALVPATALGDAMHLKEWLTNDPTGVNQVAFVKRMAETVEREKEIAGDQVKKAQVQRLAAYGKLKKERPDEYKALLGSYGIDPDTNIDNQGRYVSTRNKLTPPPQGVGEEGIAYGASAPDDGAISMMAPNGKIKRVPREQLQAALAAGGKLVGG